MATDDGIPGDVDETTWAEMQGRAAQIRVELGRTGDAGSRRLLQERLAEALEVIAEVESRWDRADKGRSGVDDAADLAPPSPDEPGDGAPELNTIDELLAELLRDEDETEDRGPEAEIIEERAPHPEIVEQGEPRTESLEDQDPYPDLPEEAITTARRRTHAGATMTGNQLVVELARSTGHHRSIDPTGGRAQPAPDARPKVDRPTVDSSGSAPRSATALRIAGTFALAAVVGIAGILLLSSRGSTDDAVPTADPADPVDSTDPAEAGGELGELREILAIIGFEDLQVERDGSLIRMSGTVASAGRLQMARNAAAALVDDAELDMSGVVIGRPAGGVSESSSSVGTERFESSLQRDLDRLLATTPIMFDLGRSELGELDRRILNAVVAILLSAPPDAAVTIIGHGDGDRADDGDAELAAARAEEVRDYLADRGVAGDLLRAEGGAPGAADGVSGTIEVEVTLDG